MSFYSINYLVHSRIMFIFATIMIKVIVSHEIADMCPEFVGACVEAQVVNSPYCQELWQEIERWGE